MKSAPRTEGPDLKTVAEKVRGHGGRPSASGESGPISMTEPMLLPAPS